jgi:hypothetical protein
MVAAADIAAAGGRCNKLWCRTEGDESLSEGYLRWHPSGWKTLSSISARAGGKGLETKAMHLDGLPPSPCRLSLGSP